MNKSIKIFISSAVVSIPVIVFAQTKDLNYLIGIVAKYLNQALLLLMGLAVVLFVYYVIMFFMRPSDKRADGAKYLMWSFIGFFVILCFWGIVNILVNTFDLGSSKPTSWSEYFNIFPSTGGTSNTTQNK
jgi:hypothetical protein